MSPEWAKIRKPPDSACKSISSDSASFAGQQDRRSNAASDWTVQLTSSMGNVRQTLQDVRSQLRDMNVPSELSDSSQIILAEVLNNVVEHAYGFEGGHPLTLSITPCPDGLWCDIFDEGLPMPNGVPPNGSMPKVDPATPSDLPEGGFGWAMVRALTEGIEYQRDGSVNHLSFLVPAPQS